jgi:hypothetical protein
VRRPVLLGLVFRAIEIFADRFDFLQRNIDRPILISNVNAPIDVADLDGTIPISQILGPDRTVQADGPVSIGNHYPHCLWDPDSQIRLDAFALLCTQLISICGNCISGRLGFYFDLQQTRQLFGPRLILLLDLFFQPDLQLGKVMHTDINVPVLVLNLQCSIFPCQGPRLLLDISKALVGFVKDAERLIRRDVKNVRKVREVKAHCLGDSTSQHQEEKEQNNVTTCQQTSPCRAWVFTRLEVANQLAQPPKDNEKGPVLGKDRPGMNLEP